MQPYIVYVKIDDQNRIIAVNSSAFLADVTGWVEIDSGFGDKYHHAQGNYFPLDIYDKRGICVYKLVDGQPVERTQEEMDADLPVEEAAPDEPPDEPVDDKEARIAALEAAMRAIQEGIASV